LEALSKRGRTGNQRLPQKKGANNTRTGRRRPSQKAVRAKPTTTASKKNFRSWGGQRDFRHPMRDGVYAKKNRRNARVRVSWASLGNYETEKPSTGGEGLRKTPLAPSGPRVRQKKDRKKQKSWHEMVIKKRFGKNIKKASHLLRRPGHGASATHSTPPKSQKPVKRGARILAGQRPAPLPVGET